MKLSYEKDFRSDRPDGRLMSAMAAHMEYLRRLKPRLALPEDMTPEGFPAWQAQVRAKVGELL